VATGDDTVGDRAAQQPLNGGAEPFTPRPNDDHQGVVFLGDCDDQRRGFGPGGVVGPAGRGAGQDGLDGVMLLGEGPPGLIG